MYTTLIQVIHAPTGKLLQQAVGYNGRVRVIFNNNTLPIIQNVNETMHILRNGKHKRILVTRTVYLKGD